MSGPGALALLERVCDARIDRPVGRVVYTQFLNGDGGIVADLTVTRLAEDALPGRDRGGAVDSDLRLAASCSTRDGPVEIGDVSDELAVDRALGPARAATCSRRSPTTTSRTRRSRSAPRARSRSAAHRVLAQRITFVGELGFELYVAPEWAVQVWDRLMAAGEAHDIRAGGYRVLESLRIEKGYRYFGTDLTRLGYAVRGRRGLLRGEDKAFIGAAALAAARAAPPGADVVLDGDGLPRVYGGEAVRLDGAVVGRVRTCAYAHTVEAQRRARDGAPRSRGRRPRHCRRSRRAGRRDRGDGRAPRLSGNSADAVGVVSEIGAARSQRG